VTVLRRVLSEALPELLDLVLEERRPGFLEGLNGLLRQSDDTEVESWLPGLFGNDDDVIAQAALLCRTSTPLNRHPSFSTRPGRFTRRAT
jgi:hypothetical protein